MAEIGKQEINELVRVFKEVKGTSFISYVYRNEQGELARYFGIFGQALNHSTMNRGDLARLTAKKQTVIQTVEAKYSPQAVQQAYLEKINSLQTSLAGTNVRSQAQIDAYQYIEGCNIKVNLNTREFYITFYLLRKEVIEAGTYKKVNSKEVTLAKRMIEKEFCKASRIRTLKITAEQLSMVKTGGKVLDFGTV